MEDLPAPPLEGIRVLDFTHVLAGPVCSRLLVDLGADVLKVETGKRKDRPWSGVQGEVRGRSPAFALVHRGKRSITIDLKTDAGAGLARRLASVADVVVENFSAGVMDRLGLGFRQLQAINPRLVFVSMSGYGNDGPRSHWTSMNVILQAHSGLMMATERDGVPPVAIANSWMDYIGGLHGCFSVLEGLRRRDESGQGCYIDLSQFECAVSTIGSHLVSGLVDGPPQRLGNRSTSVAPQGCYRCAGADEWCAISIDDDRQWHAFVDVLGTPAWALESRFETLAGRFEGHDELDERIGAWTHTMRAADVVEKLRTAGVSAERVKTIVDVLDADRGNDAIFRSVPVDGQTVLLTALPIRFRPNLAPAFEPVARLGEHTDDALTHWLTLTADELDDLRSAEVLI